MQELQSSVFEHMERFYNSKRPHGSFGLLTLNEMEKIMLGAAQNTCLKNNLQKSFHFLDYSPVPAFYKTAYILNKSSSLLYMSSSSTQTSTYFLFKNS